MTGTKRCLNFLPGMVIGSWIAAWLFRPALSWDYGVGVTVAAVLVVLANVIYDLQETA